MDIPQFKLQLFEFKIQFKTLFTANQFENIFTANNRSLDLRSIQQAGIKNFTGLL
jgi:hypothetical protein